MYIEDENGCAAYSDCVAGVISSLEEYDNMISIFPNPVRNELIVQCDDNVEYQIRSIHGQIMKTQNSNSKLQKIDVSKFPNGVYLLKLVSQETTNHFHYKFTKH